MRPAPRRRHPVSVLLAALGTALLASGCLQTGGVAPAAAVDEPLVDAVVARLTAVLDAEGGMGEPSLGVAADGTLFGNGRANNGAQFDPGAAYRSRDGGATWEKLGAPTDPMPNLDPDLAVDADGVVWFDTLYVGCTTVSVSRDQGDTWSTPNPLACVPPAGDRQYVIPTKGGTAYTYAHNLPTFYQIGAKTTDYGQTWTPLGPVEGLPTHHLLVNEGTGWGGGGFWNPTTDSVFFTYTWFVNTAPGATAGRTAHPAAHVTRDGGLTWDLIRLDPMVGQYHGLSLVVGAADEGGNVYLSWSSTDLDTNDSAVYVAGSQDDGVTWTPPIRVDADNDSSAYPAITAGAAGEVAIAYYDADVPGYPSTLPEQAAWNVTLAWTKDLFAASPTWERGQLSTHEVKRGPICVNGSGCGQNRELLDYFSAKRLPDGRVGALWASTEDVEGETVNVYGATDAAVLSPWAG